MFLLRAAARPWAASNFVARVFLLLKKFFFVAAFEGLKFSAAAALKAAEQWSRQTLRKFSTLSPRIEGLKFSAAKIL